MDVLFEDNKGRLLSAKEVDRLPPWEIEERGIHLVSM